MLDRKTLEKVYKLDCKQQKYIKAIEKLNYKVELLDRSRRLFKYEYIDCFISTPSYYSMTITLTRDSINRGYMYEDYIKINKKVEDYAKKILNLEADKFDLLGLHD